MIWGSDSVRLPQKSGLQDMIEKWEVNLTKTERENIFTGHTWMCEIVHQGQSNDGFSWLYGDAWSGQMAR